jgi:hypothetical protein
MIEQGSSNSFISDTSLDRIAGLEKIISADDIAMALGASQGRK